LAASLGLTIGIAVLFIAGGALRLVLAYQLWQLIGWLLLLSGLIGVATGVIIIIGLAVERTGRARDAVRQSI